VLSTSPSPNGSLSEGMSNFLMRRRTMSYHVPQSSPLVAAGTTAAPLGSGGMGVTASGTLASLASSFGVFRKSKKEEVGDAIVGTTEAGATGERSSVVARI
jgi:autophagy-related protein 11